MPLDEHQEMVLVSLLARVLPSPEFDDATRADALRRLRSNADRDPDAFGQHLPIWLKWLESEAFCVFSDHWLNLHNSTQDEVLDRIEADNLRTGLEEFDPIAFYQQFLKHVSDILEESKPQ